MLKNQLYFFSNMIEKISPELYGKEMNFLKTVGLLAILFIFSTVNCKQHEIIGNVEDFYYQPIRAEYIYDISGDLRDFITRKVVIVSKIEKKSWGYILYEIHKDFLTEKAKKKLKEFNHSGETHKYMKVIVNRADQYIEIFLTDSKWLKEGDKLKILRGTIKDGNTWHELVKVTKIGPIQVQPPPQKNEVPKTIIKKRKTMFEIHKHDNIIFNNKSYEAIKIHMIFRVSDMENVFVDKSIYLKSLGIYLNEGRWKLKEVKYIN